MGVQIGYNKRVKGKLMNGFVFCFRVISDIPGLHRGTNMPPLFVNFDRVPYI